MKAQPKLSLNLEQVVEKLNESASQSCHIDIELLNEWISAGLISLEDEFGQCKITDEEFEKILYIRELIIQNGFNIEETKKILSVGLIKRNTAIHIDGEIQEVSALEEKLKNIILHTEIRMKQVFDRSEKKIMNKLNGLENNIIPNEKEEERENEDVFSYPSIESLEEERIIIKSYQNDIKYMKKEHEEEIEALKKQHTREIEKVIREKRREYEELLYASMLKRKKLKEEFENKRHS